MSNKVTKSGSKLSLVYFYKYEIIETHARAFLTLVILDIGNVESFIACPSGF